MLTLIKKIVKKPIIYVFDVLLRNSHYARDIVEINRNISELKKIIKEENRATSDNVALLIRNKRTTRKRIGFLVHNIEAWSGLEPVYKAMVADDAFDPIVFSVNRKYFGDIYRDEGRISEILTGKGIAHIRLNDIDSFKDLSLIKLQNLDGLFRQSHWLPDLPPAFQPSYLSFTNLYYLSYEVGVMPLQGFDYRYSEYERLCSKVFLASKEIKEEMDNLPNATGVESVVTGHPKVTQLLSSKPFWPIKTHNKVKIIWSAHHSIGCGWNDFGVFDKVFEDFLDLAMKRKDWDFLFSPHPALIHRIENLKDLELKKRIDHFEEEWKKLDNTSIVEMGDYFGPFQASSILIIDGLSLMIEYQLLGKPVIQLVRSDSSDYTEFGKRVCRGVHRLPYSKVKEIERRITTLLQTQDSLMSEQLKLKEELTRERDPARRILEEIKEDLL